MGLNDNFLSFKVNKNLQNVESSFTFLKAKCKEVYINIEIITIIENYKTVWRAWHMPLMISKKTGFCKVENG